ncbi:MAG: phosphatidate cytidylyltransferase [Candidatus Bathyarchaeota archaeon]|nr:phosphatidate cytidylyltransferase [Candidatus Bathyarchaeota archaeon]
MIWSVARMMGIGWGDINLILVSYGYILALILISGRLEGVLGLSRGSARKFLHVMIGNLVLVVPFFRWPPASVIIAAPFILVTVLASPYSPIPRLRALLGGLVDLTEEGHHLGLILYSFSFTLLVVLFPMRPDVVVAGILPMAYGDSSAALVGRRLGKRETLNGKTVEGSAAMFTVSLISLILGLAFISTVHSFDLTQSLVPAVTVAIVCTLVEALSPRGLDNLAVPVLGALTFYLASGGL